MASVRSSQSLVATCSRGFAGLLALLGGTWCDRRNRLGGWGLALGLLLSGWHLQNNSQAQTHPQAGKRHEVLLVLETSRNMGRRDRGILETARQLLTSNFEGQLRRGDGLQIWTFNEDLYRGWADVTNWPAEASALVGALGVIQGQTFEKRASLEKVLPELGRFLAGVECATAVLMTAGEGPMHGTPFDQPINEAWARWRDEQQKNRMPILTLLRAEAGRVTHWQVAPAPWPLDFPPLPVPQTVVSASGPLAAAPEPKSSPTPSQTNRAPAFPPTAVPSAETNPVTARSAPAIPRTTSSVAPRTNAAIVAATNAPKVQEPKVPNVAVQQGTNNALVAPLILKGSELKPQKGDGKTQKPSLGGASSTPAATAGSPGYVAQPNRKTIAAASVEPAVNPAPVESPSRVAETDDPVTQDILKGVSAVPAVAAREVSNHPTEPAPMSMTPTDPVGSTNSLSISATGAPVQTWRDLLVGQVGWLLLLGVVFVFTMICFGLWIREQARPKVNLGDPLELALGRPVAPPSRRLAPKNAGPSPNGPESASQPHEAGSSSERQSF